MGTQADVRQISAARPPTEAAYEALRESICTGALAPGERLIQTEPADRLMVGLPRHPGPVLIVDSCSVRAKRRGGGLTGSAPALASAGQGTAPGWAEGGGP